MSELNITDLEADEALIPGLKEALGGYKDSELRFPPELISGLGSNQEIRRRAEIGTITTFAVLDLITFLLFRVLKGETIRPEFVSISLLGALGAKFYLLPELQFYFLMKRRDRIQWIRNLVYNTMPEALAQSTMATPDTSGEPS